MAYVITRLCRDCIDGSCVDACPIDCILEHRPADGRSSDLARQLFIDPVECIDCNCCLPACPWEAIYPDKDIPLPFKDDIALNARASIGSPDFHVPVERLRRGTTTPEEVDENKRKWGL